MCLIMGDQSRVGGSGSANGSPGSVPRFGVLAQRGQRHPHRKRPVQGYARLVNVLTFQWMEMSRRENETIMLAAVEGEKLRRYSSRMWWISPL